MGVRRKDGSILVIWELKAYHRAYAVTHEETTLTRMTRSFFVTGSM